MNVDDELGFAQLFGEAHVFAAQPLHNGVGLFGDGIALGFGTALVRCEPLQNAGVPFAPPGGEQRRIQSFAPQQRTDAARAFGLIGLGKDELLVLGGEAAALGVGHDLGIGAGLGLGAGYAATAGAGTL